MSYNYPDLSLKEGNEGGESRIGETLAICRVLAPPPRWANAQVQYCGGLQGVL